MHKNTKSKKTSNEKLRKVLDNGSIEDSSTEEKKYLDSLGKRLEGQSIKDTVEYKKVLGATNGGEIDSLKPRVTIHHGPERKSYIITEEKKSIPELPKVVEKKELPESLQKEELYEIEKFEAHEPEFIEVKPKETSKLSKEEIGEEIVKVEEEKIEKKDEVPEWEPLEESIIKQEEKEEPHEEIIEKKDETPEYRPVEIKEETKESKSFKEEELIEWEPIESQEDKEISEQLEEKETEPIPSFIPVKKIEKKEKEPEWEPVEESITEEEGKEVVEREKKIEAFKDIKCIDEKTAILLYDTGFTTVDDLKKISLRNLKKVDGISSKLAKKIKKEIEGTIKPTAEDNGSFSEYLIDEDFEKSKEDIVDKKIIEKETEEINVFKDIECIDKKTAKLLYENGITSIRILRDTSIDDLIKIRGIRRKLAKKIKKELTSIPTEEEEVKSEEKDIPFESVDIGEWEYFDEKEAKKGKKEKKKGFRFGEYALYEKKITTKGNKKKTIRFFSKSKPRQGKSINLPKGFEVKVNKKTKLPYLKKK